MNLKSILEDAFKKNLIVKNNMDKNEPFAVWNSAYKKNLYLYKGSYIRPDKKLFTYYYFSGKKNAGALESIPEGWEIAVSPRSQMFFLRKIKKDDNNRAKEKIS